MLIHIRNFLGTDDKFLAKEKDLIINLKEKYQQKYGILTEFQNIIYNDKILDNYTALVYYGINEKSKLIFTRKFLV